jgi:acyl transferase domain-containing protein
VLLQYAMWSALAQLGLVPEAAAGHSAGEVMAAYATGQLSREQLCQLIYARAAALAQLPEGSMAAVVGDMQVRAGGTPAVARHAAACRKPKTE